MNNCAGPQKNRLTLLRIPMVFLIATLLFGSTVSDVLRTGNMVYGSTDATCQLTWTHVPGPNVGALYAVEAVSTNDVWAGGGGDFLHWNGNTWSIVLKPVSGTIQDIAAVASHDVWAVTADGSILQWNGTVWKIITQTNAALSKIAALSPTDIWAVGNDPFLKGLAFHWDGTTWNPISTPEGSLFGITALTTNDMWAVGQVLDNALTIHWDGTSWSFVPSLDGTPPNGPELLSVAGTASDDVWAVGKLWWRQPNWFTMIAHWNGNEWQEMSHPYGWLGAFNDVSAIAHDDAWAVGWARFTRKLVKRHLMENWDGSAWNVINMPRIADSHLNAIAAVSSQELWAVGANIWHGGLPCVSNKPQVPILRSPQNRTTLSVTRTWLKWKSMANASWYELKIKQGKKIFKQEMYLTAPRYLAKGFKRGETYTWQVTACNAIGCSRSPWLEFSVLP